MTNAASVQNTSMLKTASLTNGRRRKKLLNPPSAYAAAMPAGKNFDGWHVRLAVRVKGHAAGEQNAHGVHVGQNRQRRGQPGKFGQQEIGPGPPAWTAPPAPCPCGFPAPGRTTRSTPPRTGPTKTWPPARSFHQFGLIAKRKVIWHRQEHLKQDGYRHQQQKNWLPNQLHKSIDGDGKKLSHV